MVSKSTSWLCENPSERVFLHACTPGESKEPATLKSSGARSRGSKPRGSFLKEWGCKLGDGGVSSEHGETDEDRREARALRNGDAERSRVIRDIFFSTRDRIEGGVGYSKERR